MNLPGGAELILIAVMIGVPIAALVGLAWLVSYFVRRDQQRR